jgi:probable F420-dependent oxidoreductase
MLLDHYCYSAAPASVPALAASLQDAGVDGVFFAESTRDPAVAVTLAAEHSRTLTVGTGITIAFARSPMTTAYSAWTLQEAAGGRFVLGLGSQVKAHIERRFDMPWSRPVARMRDYLQALDAIWDSWATGSALAHRGEFYAVDLMPEPFRPPDTGTTRPPVHLAAVGPAMARLAGAAAQGVVCHPFCGPGYLADRLLPDVADGARSALRQPESVDVAATVMVATGNDDVAVAAATALVRERIAFYASTPAYRPVLEHYGAGDLQQRAQQLVRERRWAELPDLVDDDVLHRFAVVGRPEQLGALLRERYCGIATRIALSTDHEFTATQWRSLSTAVHGGQEGDPGADHHGDSGRTPGSTASAPPAPHPQDRSEPA